MHPLQDKLKSIVEGTLDDLSSSEVSDHIEACELCREFCQAYRLLIDSLAEARHEDLPPSAQENADKLYLDAIKTNVIPLLTLANDEKDAYDDVLLAADSQPEPVQAIKNLATLYSEDPEVVLRVMRDSNQGRDYVQLIGDESSLVSFVLVQIPELDKEYITDKSGFAALEGDSLEEYEKLKWRIKLPDAVFNLEPLLYDPDKVEYSKELILETDNHDKIKIVYEGKTEGSQITLQILAMDGETEYGNIRVVVSQQRESIMREARPNETVEFNISDSNDQINIRIFQK